MILKLFDLKVMIIARIGAGWYAVSFDGGLFCPAFTLFYYALLMPVPAFIQPPYPWFLTQWQQFVEQVRADRLPHALLLKGQMGIGATALAEAMAQFLLCRSPADMQSCGQCRGCELLSSSTHPDFLHIKPEEKSSIVKVAQVRTLGQFVANTAQQGGRKVIVLEPAEAMNHESANALLKNLEEPAGDTVFILVGYQVARVLPTIRSRTAQISLISPSESESLAWLERNQVSNAAELLNASGGTPLTAMQWFEGNTLEQYQEIAERIEQASMGQRSIVDAAKSLASHDLVNVMTLLQQWLQSAIRVNSAEQSDSLPLVQQLATLPAQALYQLLDSTQQRLAQLYAGSNPNKVLACEELLLLLQAARTAQAVPARR